VDKELSQRSTTNVRVTGGAMQPGAKAWADFFAFMRSVEVPTDFMVARPLNTPPVEKDVFGDVA